MAVESAPGSGAPTAVHRYWHAGDRDWVSIPAHGNQPSAATMAANGYRIAPEPQYYVHYIGNPDMVAVYRWWHPGDRDWIDVPEGSIPDSTLANWGYTSRAFQFYAHRDPHPGTVAVYRWWHPGDRDWVTLRDGEVPDSTMAANGYQNKTLLFHADGTRPTTSAYFPFGAAQGAVLQPVSWSEEHDHPHTMSVLDVNPGRDPAQNGGFRFLAYWGHHECSGIGIARAQDPAGPWVQQAAPLFRGNGERWASAMLTPDNRIALVHNVFWCGGSPDGLPYHVVGRTSTDGRGGTAFTAPRALVKEPGNVNGNPTLFRDPQDGRVHLYWFREAPGRREIRVRSAATFSALFDVDPATPGQLVAVCPDVVAAPQVVRIGGTCYLAVETLEDGNVWKTRVLTSANPTSGFLEIPDGPVYGDSVACAFQHVFDNRLHTFYCQEHGAGTADWTLDHRSAPLP
ncbi:sialidase family protein [Actinosynnema sp. NPDC059335]|uniref:sialidase family protein n=1 Tax=Actinosynnema sp. NPDC059335 TaxID=3346804 RepID=UPI00366D2CAC